MRKKYRSITVDGVKYNWMIVSRKKGVVTVIVNKDGFKDAKIEVDVVSDTAEFWVEFPDVSDLVMRIVSVKELSMMIRQALDMGWETETKTQPILFSFDEESCSIVRK